MNAGESVRAIGKPGIDTLRFTTCAVEFDTTFAFANIGNIVLHIDSISATGLDLRPVSPNLASLPQAVVAGKARNITVAITLPTPGTYTGTLRITTDANNRKVFEIPIIATRDSARLAVPTTIDFGVISATETTHDTTVIVRNTGSKPITLTATDLVGTAFTVLSPSLPHVIAPGSTDSIRLRITPNNALREGKLTLRGDPCLNGLDIALRGFQGGGASLLAARSIDYPSYLCTAPASVDSTLLIRSIGDEPVTITAATISGAQKDEFRLLDDPVALSPILPGDSMKLRVQWTPNSRGQATAALVLTTTAINAPTLSVALRGAKDTAALSASLSAIDFGRLRSCDATLDTTITLSNDGTIADTITALDFGGVTAYSISPSLPIIVYPGTPQTLRIRFTPKSDASFPATLRIIGSACNSAAVIDLSGRRISPMLATPTTTITFDTLYGCSATAVTRKIGVRNTGEIADTISAATLAGNAAFTLSSTAFPLVLQPGESDSISVRFAPSGGGDYIGVVELEWGPCQQTTRIDMRGIVIAPAVGLSTTDVNFGRVDVGASSRQTLVITNTGTGPRTITGIDLGSATEVRVISPTSFPVELAVGQSLTVELEYTPKQIGGLSLTAAVAIAEPCSETKAVTVRGEGIGEEFVRASLTLAVPEVVTGMIDKTVEIPVSITASTNLAAVKLRSLRFVLRHRYTLLAPIQPTVTTAIAGMTVTVIGDEIVGSERKLEVEISGGEFPAEGEIARISRLVLIGDAEVTPLVLDSVSLSLAQTNATASVTLQGGEFRAEGLCRTGRCTTGASWWSSTEECATESIP